MLKGRCIKADGLTSLKKGHMYFLERFGQVAYVVYTLEMERVGVFQRKRFVLLDPEFNFF